MIRKKITPRNNWQAEVENLGFGFHSTDVPYWDESVYYSFRLDEIDDIAKATTTLHEMCLNAVQYVIDNKKYDLFKIPSFVIPYLENSWNNDAPAIYGRMDLCYKNGEIKLLEFNADTPTSLYEAGIVQWFWLQDFAKDKDQFNSIHEKLIAYWKYVKPFLNQGKVHFSCVKESLEDLTNTEYMRDCAIQAGLDTKLIFIDDIGANDAIQSFVDMEEETITNIFKLYPWEWLLEEEFGMMLIDEKQKCNWIEPAWKMILSNKAILPILWQLYPNHPNLLRAEFTNTNMTNYVKKPILSREGANITLVENGKSIQDSTGEYGKEGYIFQELFTLPNFDDNYPVIGSWIIGQETAGIGIRESKTLITDNVSRFVPHLID
jgi:glutathionylspermidine synthase